MTSHSNGIGNKLVFGVDDILNIVGEFGPFQWMLTLVCVCLYIAPVMQMYIMYFVLTELPWKCINNSSLCTLNGTQTSGNDYRCGIARSEWEYVQDADSSSVTAEYDLVCDSFWLVYMASSVFYLGKLFGAFIGGWLSDSFGRKTVIYPSYTLLLLANLITIISPNIWLFLACRFVSGFATDAIVNQVLLLLSEFVTTRYRPIAVNVLWVGWIATCCFLPLVAYYIRHWKMLFVVCTVPYALFLVTCFIVPESVRWYRAKERYRDANIVFREIARWNRRSLDENVDVAKVTYCSERTTYLDILVRNELHI